MLNYHFLCSVSQAFIILIDFRVSIASKILRIVFMYCRLDITGHIFQFTDSYKVKRCDRHFVTDLLKM